MLESLPVVLAVGTVLGFLSGLGIGGGSLLIIWLTAVLGRDPAEARTMNLMFFLPAALVTCVVRCRTGNLDLKSPVPGILSGCVMAIPGCLLAARLDIQLLKKLFGAVLIFTGCRELFYRTRKPR